MANKKPDLTKRPKLPSGGEQLQSSRKEPREPQPSRERIHHQQPTNKQIGVFYIEERRKIVAELYLANWAQWEIAKHCNIEQGTVAKDLEAIRQIWLSRAVDAISEATKIELAKIDKIERIATDEYIKSMGIRKQRTTETIEGGENMLTKEKVVRERRLGDTRYLDQLKWCIEMRCKILGITKEKQAAQVNNLISLDWDSIVTKSTGDSINDEILQLEALPEVTKSDVEETE